MGIMVDRLRQSIAKLGGAGSAPTPVDRGGGLDKKTLAELQRELDGKDPTPFAAGSTIMSAGAVGASMYVVMSGRVAVSVKDRVVERLGPGAIFGEIALVDRSARAASATAETDCTLFAIGRNEFLALVKAKPAFGASLLKSIAERMQHLAAQVS
jgi:CRP-like cAMP-binding protein